jgi:hypothetical protein
MALPHAFVEAVWRFEAEIRRLQDYGLAFGKAGYSARLMAKKQEMADKYAEEQRVWEEINRTMLPDLMTAYISGGPLERLEIPDLLKANPKFAWGIGWDHRDDASKTEVPAQASGLRHRIVLFSMKDGHKDWRDEIVILDALCTAGRKAGLDTAQLLREAAEMSSDMARGDRPSLRTVLLNRADRLIGGAGLEA